MTEAQTYSWIFYAISAVAHDSGVKHREIEAVADGINHAVPTQKEISSSLKWLQSKGLLKNEGKKVILTDEGKELATRLKERPGGVMNVWDRISKEFKRMGADDKLNLNCQTMEAEPASGHNSGGCTPSA